MKNFNSLPEFDKDKKRLVKKFPSVPEDLRSFAEILQIAPTGIGKNFTIVHAGVDVQVVKARLACRTLKNRSLRVVYAYHKEQITFMYIELYAKNDKNNEDRQRIQKYLDSLE